MKKQSRLIALLLTVLIVLAVCSANALAADSEGEKDYLALGDSISTGYGLTNAVDQGYTYLVAMQGGYELENRAVNGYTAENIYDLVKDGTLDGSIAEAELITLTCGGNDLMEILYAAIADAYNAEKDPDIEPWEVLSAFAGTHDTLTITALMPYASAVLVGFAQTDSFRMGLEKYKADLTNVMEYLRDRNTDARIVLNTQYNPYDSFEGNVLYGSLYSEIEPGVAALNEVIEENAAALGYTVADVYSAFKASSENLCIANADNLLSPNLDFHPNAAGHAVIAATVMTVLEPEAETTTEEMTTVAETVGGESTSESPFETTDALTVFRPETTLPETESAPQGAETTVIDEASATTEEVEEIETPDCGAVDPVQTTEEPDEKETDAPTAGGEDPDAPDEAKSGCGSVMSFHALLLTSLSAAPVVLLLRRREVEQG